MIRQLALYFLERTVMSKKLSPYGFDWGRFLSLIARPNYRLSNAQQPDDSVFPASGLIHITGAVSPEICNQVIADYDRFEAYRKKMDCLINGDDGRNLRLTNFHLASDALLEIGLSQCFHEPISDFFRNPSTIYTSLTYKHGSQQSAHIDTPFFWTRPFNLFTGVWVALEDVYDDAGPLFYYPGSHMLWTDEVALRKIYDESNQDLSRMFELMRERAEQQVGKTELKIKAGDAVIWHPGLLHGGSFATNSIKTRYSTVFHFASLGTNVRDNRVFPNEFINLPTYGVKSRNGKYYCRGGLPTVMR